MVSFDLFPEPEINPGPQQTIQQELKIEKIIMISLLTNSQHYFIDCVFIAKLENKYRLVALHNRRVLYDNYYPTLRGCKIAFGRLFKEKAFSIDIKPDWSLLYDPDKSWLGEKISYLEKGV